MVAIVNPPGVGAVDACDVDRAYPVKNAGFSLDDFTTLVVEPTKDLRDVAATVLERVVPSEKPESRTKLQWLAGKVYNLLYVAAAAVGGLFGRGVAAVYGPQLLYHYLVYRMGGGLSAQLLAYTAVGGVSNQMLWAGGIIGATVVPLSVWGVAKGTPYLYYGCKGVVLKVVEVVKAVFRKIGSLGKGRVDSIPYPEINMMASARA